MRYSYVSLFSGAGGLDIGLERSGLNPVSMCELEKVFCDTLLGNRGWIHCDGRDYLNSARIINADIREISCSDLYQGDGLDLVVGGPPCQSFSSSGKGLSVLDARGTLITEFCRLLDELKPRMFLFENVRGFITARDRTGEPGGVLIKFINILEETGYSCRAALLNAADYGAYQRRIRCFIIGSRKGEAPHFPGPSFQKNVGLFSNRWLSLETFLLKHGDMDQNNFIYPSPQLAKQLENIPEGCGLKSPGKAEATRPGGHWGYRQGTFIADLSQPARTITGSPSQDWVRWNGALRRLTFTEVKLLQGFPEDWIVHGTKAQQYKQIGNAVPAVFGEALGSVIVSHLDRFPVENPVHIELPKSFNGYIEYTKKDHLRNESSRTVHRYFAESLG